MSLRVQKIVNCVFQRHHLISMTMLSHKSGKYRKWKILIQGPVSSEGWLEITLSDIDGEQLCILLLLASKYMHKAQKQQQTCNYRISGIAELSNMYNDVF